MPERSAVCLLFIAISLPGVAFGFDRDDPRVQGRLDIPRYRESPGPINQSESYRGPGNDSALAELRAEATQPRSFGFCRAQDPYLLKLWHRGDSRSHPL
jgi:hypothetical protein